VVIAALWFHPVYFSFQQIQATWDVKSELWKKQPGNKDFEYNEEDNEESEQQDFEANEPEHEQQNEQNFEEQPEQYISCHDFALAGEVLCTLDGRYKPYVIEGIAFRLGLPILPTPEQQQQNPTTTNDQPEHSPQKPTTTIEQPEEHTPKKQQQPTTERSKNPKKRTAEKQQPPAKMARTGKEIMCSCR